MKTIALAVLLLFAAAPAPAVASGDGVTARSDPPGSRDGHVEPWTPSQRATVMSGCQRAFPGEDICACLTHEIEVLSADPEVMTAEVVQTGLERCRKVRAEAPGTRL